MHGEFYSWILGLKMAAFYKYIIWKHSNILCTSLIHCCASFWGLRAFVIWFALCLYKYWHWNSWVIECPSSCSATRWFIILYVIISIFLKGNCIYYFFPFWLLPCVWLILIITEIRGTWNFKLKKKQGKKEKRNFEWRK